MHSNLNISKHRDNLNFYIELVLKNWLDNSEKVETAISFKMFLA